MPLPYERASTGKKALDETQALLRAFGATSFGVMDDFEHGTLTLQFQWRERRVTLTASAKGYAAAWLREHPWSSRRRSTLREYEREALKQGSIAVYSMLRDWVKGQLTAVETGMLTFESAFLAQIMLPTGETVLERLVADNVVQIAGPHTQTKLAAP